MKVVFSQNKDDEFTIVPTDDREITRKFVDYETGYIIVHEQKKHDPSDKRIYCTVIDPGDGSIIDPKTRLTQIDTTEKVVIDEVANLKLLMRRSIDMSTGKEFLDQELFDLMSGKKISSGRGLAFSAKKKNNLIEWYYERREEERENKRFWDEEYPTYSLEEKKAFWLRYFYSAMRSQGEVGADEYWLFTKKNYAEWCRSEPNMDMMLAYVIEKLPHYDTDEIRKRLAEIHNSVE